MSKEIDKTDDLNDGSAVERVTDLVEGALSGVPAPIRKNAFKAIARLCTATVDLPVAYLKGLAAEKRAESKARVKIIGETANQIVNQMKLNPEYAKAAIDKYSEKIIRERLNVDTIILNAAEELSAIKQLPPPANSEGAPESEISDDWLNTFESEAINKSSEDMRLLFGRILAGEIQRPSSFSIKTIKIISQLDNRAARLFHILCSLSMKLEVPDRILDSRVVTFGKSAAQNGLSKYGLNFSDLNILHEYGLIIAEYNSWMDFGVSVIRSEIGPTLPFYYAGKYFGLRPKTGHVPQPQLKLSGVALTKSGEELLSVVEKTYSEIYSADLVQYFDGMNLEMVDMHIGP